MEQVQNNEVAEVVTQDKSHEPVANEQQKSQEQIDDRQERNWKAVRERQKELEKELRMQRDMNERLLQLATQNAPKPEVDELDQIGDEEFIPKGKVNKLVERKAQRIAEETVKRETEKFMHQHQQSQFMDRLKRQFSDFDEIVNPETLSILEEQDPELAVTIADLKDPYKIGLQSYKYIKAAGIAEKVPSARRQREVEKKLEQNAKTVQSPQAYDKRPMAQAFKMADTKEEQRKLYEEMLGYASTAGFSY